MKISDINPNLKAVELEAQITDISPIKEFSKFGKAGRLAIATLKDDSGTIPLALWDEQIDKVKIGDKIIFRGFVKEWRGELQLQTGRSGEIINKK